MQISLIINQNQQSLLFFRFWSEVSLSKACDVPATIVNFGPIKATTVGANQLDNENEAYIRANDVKPSPVKPLERKATCDFF